MLSTDGGFKSAHVLTFELSLPTSKYSNPDKMALVYTNVLQNLHTLPGVASVGLASVVPLNGAPDSSALRIPDHPSIDDRTQPYANYSFASSGYFSAVGTPILYGRDFRIDDTLESMPVTIINNAMARKLSPGENPIGKQVGVATKKWPTRTVIGVVADIKHDSLREEPAPEMYVPYTQNEIKIWPAMQTLQIAARTNAEPASILGSLRDAVHSVNPDLPIAKIATLTDLVNSSMTKTRFSMLMLISFGALSLLLSLIGLYGVISYSVQQRIRQIGIRMALGARQRDVLGMVLGEGARLAGFGIAIGILGALGATRIMDSFLYGVRATDPITFVMAAVGLFAAALLACYLPARRAAQIDPLVALRYD